MSGGRNKRYLENKMQYDEIIKDGRRWLKELEDEKIEKNRYLDILRIFESAITIDPFHHDGWLGIADTLEVATHYDKSNGYRRKALDILKTNKENVNVTSGFLKTIHDSIERVNRKKDFKIAALDYEKEYEQKKSLPIEKYVPLVRKIMDEDLIIKRFDSYPVMSAHESTLTLDESDQFAMNEALQQAILKYENFLNISRMEKKNFNKETASNSSGSSLGEELNVHIASFASNISGEMSCNSIEEKNICEEATLYSSESNLRDESCIGGAALSNSKSVENATEKSKENNRLKKYRHYGLFAIVAIKSEEETAGKEITRSFK